MKDHVPYSLIKDRSRILRELDLKLQHDFWQRFVGKQRYAIREGKKNTFLTDNYIRVETSPGSYSNINKIINVKIGVKSGKPWGVIDHGIA
jgi:tRNA A37 methylthiotransferase MiaB